MGVTKQNEPAPEPAVKQVWWKRHWKWVVLGPAVLLAVLVGFMLVKNKSSPGSLVEYSEQNGQRGISDDQADKAGKLISNNRCAGTGVPYKLSVSPMRQEDFTHIIPYGLMVGGHVTPIDHQYFSPASYQSPNDAYEVRAMADSKIVDIQERSNNDPRHGGIEYRLVFSISCTYFYYYDLVTSLTPEIKAAYDAARGNRQNAGLELAVKAGQVIGRIGGRTLDFAVWDTTKPLSGLVNPQSYTYEIWKIYTADPLNYYSDELKSFILSRYNRTAEPISGRIDYDIDGKLIGNWFEEGSNGYAGTEANRQAGGYWKTHLAIAPNHYDPTNYEVSIGSLWKAVDQENDMQHMILPPFTSPAQVGIESGLVKYSLGGFNYWQDGGSRQWDNKSFANNIVIKPNGDHFGCVAVQLTETRKLKFELFEDQQCSNVAGFTSAAKTYMR